MDSITNFVDLETSSLMGVTNAANSDSTNFYKHWALVAVFFNAGFFQTFMTNPVADYFTGSSVGTSSPLNIYK
jgi:hypothetical protein